MSTTAPAYKPGLTRLKLEAHLQSTQAKDPYLRIYFYHAHVYFPPGFMARGLEFRELVVSQWNSDDRVEVHSFFDGPAGPHPKGSFEVLFNRDVFADVVAWLQLNRPENFTVLIHPLTADMIADYTLRALWLGGVEPVKIAVVQELQAKAEAQQQAEVDVIWSASRPGLAKAAADVSLASGGRAGSA